MSARAFTERDVHMALDGELPADERADFERWLADSPEMMALNERLAADRDLLRRTLGPIVDEPLPGRFTGLAEQPRLAAASRGRSALWRAAAAVVLLGVGGVAGYYYGSLDVGGGQLEARLADGAIDAHSVYAAEKLHVVEVGADQRDHLVGWLSKRVGTKLVAPNLDSEDFSLVGGRLLPAGGAAAAQFMYQNRAGDRVSLYVTHGVPNRETGFRLFEHEDTRTFYWLEGGFGYAVAGAVPEEELLAVANAAYRQLLAAGDGG